MTTVDLAQAFIAQMLSPDLCRASKAHTRTLGGHGAFMLRLVQIRMAVLRRLLDDHYETLAGYGEGLVHSTLDLEFLANPRNGTLGHNKNLAGCV